MPRITVNGVEIESHSKFTVHRSPDVFVVNTDSTNEESSDDEEPIPDALWILKSVEKKKKSQALLRPVVVPMEIDDDDDITQEPMKTQWEKELE